MSSESVSVPPDSAPAGWRLSLTRAIDAFATGCGSGNRGGGGTTDSCGGRTAENRNAATTGKAIVGSGVRVGRVQPKLPTRAAKSTVERFAAIQIERYPTLLIEGAAGTRQDPAMPLPRRRAHP